MSTNPPSKIKANGHFYDLKFSERTKTLALRTQRRLKKEGANVIIRKYGGINYLYVRKLNIRKVNREHELEIRKLKRSPKGHKNLKYAIYIDGKHQGFSETKKEGLDVGRSLLRGLGSITERLRRSNEKRAEKKRKRFERLAQI